MRLFGSVVLLCVLGMPGRASARDVYLNNVKLDSSIIVRDQTFRGCEVKFDANGDVWITAKGFQIAVAPAAGAGPRGEDTARPAEPGARLEKRYFLVAPQRKRGLPQYDADVFVNGAFVRRVRANAERVVLEITDQVRVGRNQVKIIATKKIGEKRLSSSPEDVFEILIGEGTIGGGTVTIDRTVVTFRRNASQTGDVTEQFAFTGR